MFTENLMAEAGGDFVKDTASHSEREWAVLIILTDTKFDHITTRNFYHCELLSGLEMAAGSVFYGRVTEFQLVSGLVQAVHATGD